MHPEILPQQGYAFAHADRAPIQEFFPGVWHRPLWTGPKGAHAGVPGVDPDSSWPRRDIRDPGPEEVFVLAGTFHDGARDHPAATFLHAPAGSWHVPATTSGCTLFLCYAAG